MTNKLALCWMLVFTSFALKPAGLANCNRTTGSTHFTGSSNVAETHFSCWAWYDDICWGNIVIGTPLDLVDYYYPEPVYSSYTVYDGEEAVVYYFPTDDGQYKRVTVVDGNVVEVEIVDHIFWR